MVSTIGIDGSKNGWVTVTITETNIKIDLFAHIEQTVHYLRQADCILIDMPIGLPENERDNLLRPESKVRKLLGKRSSSVFNVPSRQSVYLDDYQLANSKNKEILKKGLSKQSYYISSKIREIDLFLKRHNQFANRILESHPELCFQMLSLQEMPVLESKKTEEGLKRRLQILAFHDMHTADISQLLKTEEFKKVKDDVVDAYCLAVAGQVGLINGFQRIPDNPKLDSRGLLMQMVYPLKKSN